MVHNDLKSQPDKGRALRVVVNRLNLETLKFVGHGLSRPECALAHQSGIVFAPDWTGAGGVSLLFPNGQVKRHLATNWGTIGPELGFDEPLRPNGICLLAGGDILLAHLGAERGGIFRLTPDGTVVPFILEVDGQMLPPTNFVTVDGARRTWITVSTRKTPRSLAYRFDVADGFIALADGDEARIVADGLGYTNECMPHPDGQRLFVNETFARQLTSFKIDHMGNLSDRQTVVELEEGTFPDGLAFDAAGDAWITSIVSNRVLRVDDSGATEIYVEDADPDHLTWVEDAWRAHRMGRPHLDKAAGKHLMNISNLAFCGPNLDQAVLGCLLDERLAVVPMPVVGAMPVHWTYDIDPLIKALETVAAI